MDGKNLGMLFAERGFVIKNPTAFTKEADNVDISELVDRLTNLEKKINSSANIVDFAKDLLERMNTLEETVNLDDYARLSDKAKLDKFNASVVKMRGYFTKVQNFIKAEERMKFQKNNLFDVMRRIYDLDKNPNLSDAERTSETLRLYKGKKDCEKEYNKSYQEYLAQRQAYNDSVKGFSLVDFKNELLAAINNIQDNCKDLALSPESNEKLQVTISDIRNQIAYYGLESIRSKTEFDSLCKRFGIASVGAPKKDVQITKDDTKTKEAEKPTLEVSKPNKDYTGPVAKGEELAVVQTPKISDTLEELKKLNPEVEFAVAEDETLDPKFNAHIKSSVPVEELKLPNNFYYTTEGISNRFNDISNPINIKVSALSRKEEPTQGLFTRANNFIKNLTKKSKIDPDKKYEVVRSRKAIIGSYGKSLLTFSALSTVGLGIAGAPLVPAALVGAGFGAIAQTIYRKVTKDTDVHIDAFENTDYEKEPENAPVVVALWHKASEKLMDVYKKRKTGEIKTNKEEELEELSSELEHGTGR